MFGKRSIGTAVMWFASFAVSFSFSSAEADPGLSSVRLREDVNRDGLVNVLDVVSLLVGARRAPGSSDYDYDGDGDCDFEDALALLRNVAGRKYSRASADENTWRIVGPGGGGGQFIPTVNPNDPDNVFLRCDMTGAYVTVDNAASWRMFNVRNVVVNFAFDPTAEGTVYVSSSGLFRSENKGLTWSLILPDPADMLAEHMEGDHADHWFETIAGQPEGEQSSMMGKLRVDPADGSHIWLARSDPWGPPYRIELTNDRGASWRRLVTGLDGEVLAIFPGSWWNKPREVLVIAGGAAVLADESSGQVTTFSLPAATVDAAEGGRGDQGVLIYAVAQNKVYRSADRARTWSSVTTSTLSGGSFNTLAVCESRPEVVYLSCNDYPSYQFGIFKSSDSGVKWDWVYRVSDSSVVTGNLRDKGWMDDLYGPSWRGSALSVGVSPSNPDICYVSDYGGTLQTLDGGKNWNQVFSNANADGSATSRGIDVTSCYGVHFDPFDSLHVFVSYTDIGASQSFDGGRSWVTGIRGAPSQWINTCYWAVFDPAVPGRVWSVWGNKHDLPRDKMFRNGWSGSSGGVARSTDSGRTWSSSSTGLPASAVCTHIVLDTTSSAASRTLYVCAFREGVYKSTNGGNSWATTAQIPGANRNYWRLCLLPDGTLFCLVVCDRQGSQTTDGGLFRTRDGGTSWQKVELPAGVNFPNDLTYDPHDPARLYLSCWPWMEVGEMVRGNWQVANRGGGLLLSTDKGDSWQRVFREDAHVYAAAVDPIDSRVIVINTFDSAAFRSRDGGASWSRLQGYNFKWGQRPVFDVRHPGMLFLTTFGGGVHYGPAAGDPAAVEDITNFRDSWRWGQSY